MKEILIISFGIIFFMVVKLSDKFLWYKENILNTIKNNPPINDSNLEFLALDVKDVGMSFEPRFEINYEVYSDKKLKGTYSGTIVCEKNYDFVTFVNLDWIEKL
jgi:hypothetical protein